MAGLTCSAIVGILCLQTPIGGSLDLKLEDQGIYINNTVSAKDWALSTGGSMERAPPQLDTAKLPQACDQGTCLRYWRKCDAAHPARCNFGIALDGLGSTFFSIASLDRDGFTHALEAVRIIVDLKAGVTIPLLKLDQDSPSDKPPLLPPIEQQRPL
jgi:hypothetical protein